MDANKHSNAAASLEGHRLALAPLLGEREADLTIGRAGEEEVAPPAAAKTAEAVPPTGEGTDGPVVRRVEVE